MNEQFYDDLKNLLLYSLHQTQIIDLHCVSLARIVECKTCVALCKMINMVCIFNICYAGSGLLTEISELYTSIGRLVQLDVFINELLSYT